LAIFSFAEIGAHVGGLASAVLFRNHFHPFRYVGFEVDGTHLDDNVVEHCLIHVQDVFEDVNRIWRLAKSQRTFLYCDGGNKIKEMRTFAPFLEPGDIIACHDYYDGQEVVGLDGFGVSDACGCVPEVWESSLKFLFEDDTFLNLPGYLLDGTRIMGFMKA